MKEQAVQQAILSMVEARGAGKSICPSEVARRLQPEDWRALMPEVRAAAATLRAQGRLRVTQGGLEVDPETARGPIRLGL
ncbi:MAG: DUF3253 domain-containing protein [Prosthecobacter sp.]|jgi:hypothetical protein|nr:DUF3253 domain-containing protein [Prosthecobacter sp.]